MLDPRKIMFLEDSAVQIDGIKFYGAAWRTRMIRPIQPRFRLPFISSKDDQINAWDAIPDDTDVLITHGPPHRILDATPTGSRIGCEVLRKRVDKVAPRVHCFGHVHHSYGHLQMDSTLFINAASVDESYSPSHVPFLIRMTKTSAELQVDLVNLS
jgi:Icc-related predicted phosphoesterase